MGSLLGIGAAAGFVSALLFAVVTSGNALSLLLYLVAPLPILIAALGWNHRAGLTGAVVASALIAILFSPLVGLVFAVSVGLPSWWFAYLLLLARTDGTATEWYPLGRLLAWIAGVSAALTLVGARLLSDSYEDFVSGFQRAAGILEELNPNAFEGLSPEAKQQSLQSFSEFVAIVAPPASAAISVATTVLLLWIAAKVVLVSGRFPRPWPELAWTTLPMGALGLLLAGIAAGIALPGFFGLGGRALAAAMVMAYCLQGLGVIHIVTRGMGGRVGILAATYVVFFLLPGWPQLLYALIGIADPFLGMRAKRVAKGGLPPPSPGST